MSMRIFTIALLGGAASLAMASTGCGTQSYTRRVALERPIVSESGETAWYIEVWDDVVEDRRNVRIRQRTTVVICRPDRVPPCVRVEPADVQDRTFFEDWVGSEAVESPAGSGGVEGQSSAPGAAAPLGPPAQN